MPSGCQLEAVVVYLAGEWAGRLEGGRVDDGARDAGIGFAIDRGAASVAVGDCCWDEVVHLVTTSASSTSEPKVNQLPSTLFFRPLASIAQRPSSLSVQMPVLTYLL